MFISSIFITQTEQFSQQQLRSSVFLQPSRRLSFAGLPHLLVVRWRFIYVNGIFHRGITKPYFQRYRRACLYCDSQHSTNQPAFSLTLSVKECQATLFAKLFYLKYENELRISLESNTKSSYWNSRILSRTWKLNLIEVLLCLCSVKNSVIDLFVPTKSCFVKNSIISEVVTLQISKYVLMYYITASTNSSLMPSYISINHNPVNVSNFRRLLPRQILWLWQSKQLLASGAIMQRA